MDRDAMISQFLDLSSSEKIVMLLLVSFYLTIAARDIFTQSDELAKVRFAKGAAEINHQITQNLISRLKSDNARYPDETLIKILYGHFESYQLLSQLPYVWGEALSKAR